MESKLIDQLVQVAEQRAHEHYVNARLMETPCTETVHTILARLVIEQVAQEFWAVDQDHMLEKLGLVQAQTPVRKPDVWSWG